MRVLNVGRSTGSSPADAALNLEGSLMGSARAQPREAAQAQGPLGATINDLVNALNPINWMGGMGGASGAAIPLNAWRGAAAMQPEAKAALNVMADRYPALMESLLASPTRMRAATLPYTAMPQAYGTMETIRPTLKMATAAGQPEAAKNPIAALMNLRSDVLADPKAATAAHEAQHLINFPRVQATNPEDAGTIGLLLDELMTGNKGTLTNRINQFADYQPISINGPISTLAESPQTIKQAADLNQRARLASGQVNMGEGYYLPGEPRSDYVQRAMMDEALAYLSERTHSPYGNPKMMSLADSLGVGTGMKYAGSGANQMPEDIARALGQYIK
jgi:hypothetical protein